MTFEFLCAARQLPCPCSKLLFRWWTEGARRYTASTGRLVSITTSFTSCVVIRPSAFGSLAVLALRFSDHHPQKEKPGKSRAFREREKGLEPSTSTLARWHSTTELLPRNSWVLDLSDRARVVKAPIAT